MPLPLLHFRYVRPCPPSLLRALQHKNLVFLFCLIKISPVPLLSPSFFCPLLRPPHSSPSILKRLVCQAPRLAFLCPQGPPVPSIISFVKFSGSPPAALKLFVFFIILPMDLAFSADKLSATCSKIFLLFSEIYSTLGISILLLAESIRCKSWPDAGLLYVSQCAIIM